MAIEKRYFDEASENIYFLSAFHNEKLNSVKFIIEDHNQGFFVDLNHDELKEFISDLNYILEQIKKVEDELH
jgi:hypothetical protein